MGAVVTQSQYSLLSDFSVFYKLARGVHSNISIPDLITNICSVYHLGFHVSNSHTCHSQLHAYLVNFSMVDTALMDDSLSLLSESEYDKTGEDILNSRAVRRSKRKSRASQSRVADYAHSKHVLSEATLRKYPKEPTAPPESDDTTPPKRVRRLVGGDTETSVETDDSSLRVPPQTEVKLRRSSKNKMKRSLSVGEKYFCDATGNIGIVLLASVQVCGGSWVFILLSISYTYW